MARYLVLEKSFIHNRLVEAGEEIEYDGKPGKALQPIKPGRRKAEQDPKPEGDAESDPLA